MAWRGLTHPPNTEHEHAGQAVRPDARDGQLGITRSCTCRGHGAPGVRGDLGCACVRVRVGDDQALHTSLPGGGGIGVSLRSRPGPWSRTCRGHGVPGVRGRQGCRCGPAHAGKNGAPGVRGRQGCACAETHALAPLLGRQGAWRGAHPPTEPRTRTRRTRRPGLAARCGVRGAFTPMCGPRRAPPRVPPALPGV